MLFSKKQTNQSPIRNKPSRQPVQGRAAQLGRSPEFRTPPAGQTRTFSYYANRSQAEINTGREAMQSKPPIRRLPGKLQKLRRHLGWLVVGILAFGLLIYELQLSSVPKIVALTNESDAPFLRDTATYEQTATALFANSAANRNKLTVDSAKIAGDMQAAFPELDDVSVSLPMFGDQATIYIRPAEPALVLASQNGSFIIDQNGRVLAQAGSQASSLHVPSVTDRSGLTVDVGKQALPKNVTEFIHMVVLQLQARHIAVQSMTLPAAASELDVYIAGAAYFVKFNIHDTGQDAARVQAGTFIALKQQLAGQNITPSQYIDVRIEGRAYYK